MTANNVPPVIRSPFSIATCLAVLSLMLSVTLFGISLSQDVFYIDRPDNPRAWVSPWACLCFGWLATLSWGANPAIALAWYCMCFRRVRHVAFLSALLALVFALSFQWQIEILTDEAGGMSNITGYGLGYWFWLSSMAAAFVGCLTSLLLDVVLPSDEPTLV